MGRKPFDLIAARAGGKVVTRDGREVNSLVYFPGPNQYVGDVMGKLYVWYGDGRGWRFRESSIDLFMATELKSGWVSIYRRGLAPPLVGGVIHATRDVAVVASEQYRQAGEYISTARIEWEE